MTSTPRIRDAWSEEQLSKFKAVYKDAKQRYTLAQQTQSSEAEGHRRLAEVMIGLYGAFFSGRAVSQDALYAVCHSLSDLSRDSGLRAVRQIIRDLRVVHGIPVLSGSAGYRLPSSRNEAEQFLARLEGEAKARARAAMETYRELAAVVRGDESNAFFDSLNLMLNQSSIED